MKSRPGRILHAAIFALLATGVSASASSLSGSYVTVTADTDYDITALGPEDWAYWSTADNPYLGGAPINEMAGQSLIGSMTDESGGGNIRGTTSNTRPASGFTFTNGTSPASGAANNPNPTGLFPTSLDTTGKGLALDITLPTTGDYTVTVWAAAYNSSGRLTASLPGATDFVDASFSGDGVAPKDVALFTIYATPDNPNDVLSLEWVMTADNGSSAHVSIQAVAVAAASAADPLLMQDTVNGDPDLEFGTTFVGAGDPVETAVRTLRYVNQGASNPIGIENVTISGDFTISDIGKNGAGGQTPPFTLAPTDYIDVSVKGTPTQTGAAPIQGELTIDTDNDDQDKTVSAAAIVYAQGDILNANRFFDSNTTNNWAQVHEWVSPGIANGSGAMVRVVGKGDPSLNEIGAANQTAGIDNTPAFESVFYFAPASVAAFNSYTGRAPSGEFTDRTMQYLVIAGNNDVRDGNTIGFAAAAFIIINLAYMPDGITAGGTTDPGFYVFDGDTGLWIPAITTTLAGSNDANNDGILDANDGDTVNAYRVSLKASDLGEPTASYTVTVSTVTPAGLTNTMTSAPLAFWHGADGTTSKMGAHSFTTADASDSNSGGGYSTPFWVDDASVIYISAPESSAAVLGAPQAMPLIDADVTTTSSTSVAVRNEGTSTALSITSMSFDDPSFSITPPAPVAIQPGAVETFTIEWDSTASAPDTAARATLSIASNDPSSPLEDSFVAGVYSDSNLLPNWNFEVPGADPDGDTDTFAFWEEGTNMFDVPGLLPGSATAVRIDPGVFMRIDTGRPADAWQFDGVFAVPATGTDVRTFNIKIRESNAGEVGLNIRYQNDIWEVFDTTQSGGTWETVLDMTSTPILPSEDADGNDSLDDPGDTKVPYQLRIAGAGWDTVTPTFSLEVLNAAGSSVAASGTVSYFRNSPPTQGAGALEFATTHGNSPGFWVDDSKITLVAANPFTDYITGLGGTDDPAAHDDADGLNNLLEFAFGLNPTVADAGKLNAATPQAGVPTTLVEFGEPIKFHALFVRHKNPAAAGLTYTAQFSADLDTWTDNDDMLNAPELVTEITGTDYEIVKVQYPIFVPPDSEKARFFRVQVELN